MTQVRHRYNIGMAPQMKCPCNLAKNDSSYHAFFPIAIVIAAHKVSYHILQKCPNYLFIFLIGAKKTQK